MPNHLASESSPYLLQHQDNPVDWHPWGEEALAKASGRTPPLIVVNLGRTTYLDSTALRVLTSVFKRVREREGEMAIAEVQPKIAKLFTLTGLDQVLPLCSTEREALAKVHPAAGT